MQLPNSGLEDHPDGTGDLNQIFNGNWDTANNWFCGAFGLTASQSTTTVTASAPIFVSDDVGATIRFADGTTVTITAFTDSQHVTVGVSQTVTSQAFELYRTSEDAYTALLRGLLKQVRMTSGDDAKTLVYDNSLKRVKLITRPGYGVTAGRILYGAGAGADATASADLTWDNSIKILAVVGRISLKNAEVSIVSPSYSSTVNIDFTAEGYVAIGTLTGNLTLTTSNLAAGRAVAVKVVCDGTARNFTFPGGWKWVGGTCPASIAANKTAILSLTAFGGSDSNVIATYLVES